MILLALLLVLPTATRAEAGRYEAVKTLAQALPAENPNADPEYLGQIGTTLTMGLDQCRYDAEEMKSIGKLVSLFDEYLGPNGGGKDALLAAIKREFPNMSASDYAGLAMGVRMAPDMTRGHLVNESCELLLRQHFDNGLTRTQWLEALEKSRPALDAAKPK